jgi:DNA-binding response OmpR family regulator
MDVAELLDRNAALEAEAQRLRDRIEELETERGVGFCAPVEWRLTGHQADAFGAILKAKADVVSKESIYNALYGGLSDVELKIVDVFVCKLRQKIEPFGIEIETVWGRGYRMSPEMKRRARALIAEAVGTLEEAA